MAQIGDVLVKFVADFAEFTKGMDDGIKRLEKFGSETAKAGNEITKTFTQLKTFVAGLGIYEVFSRLKEEADKVQAAVLKVADSAAALFVASLDDLKNWRTGVLRDWLPLYVVLAVYSLLRGYAKAAVEEYP